MIEHPLTINYGSKLEILGEKTLMGLTLCMAKKKKSRLVSCVGLYTEMGIELKPEPASANYASSDHNTQTHLTENSSAFPLQTTLPLYNLHFPHNFL